MAPALVQTLDLTFTDISTSVRSLELAIAIGQKEELPEIQGHLGRLAGALALRFATLTSPGQEAPSDCLLQIEEAAKRLSVEKDWLYQNHGRFPFTVKLGPHHLRFSDAGITKWIADQAKKR